MCLSTICKSSLENWLGFKSHAYFSIGLSFQCWVVQVLCIFWIQIPYCRCNRQIFSPILWLIFSLSWWYHLKHKIFQFTYFYFCSLGYVILLNPRSGRLTPVLLRRVLIVLVFTFRPMVRLELIFIYGVRKESSFMFLQMDMHTLLKRKDHSFPVTLFWHPCQKCVCLVLCCLIFWTRK